MPDGTQLYCRGLPRQGIRRLTDDELVELRLRVAASIRRARRERLLRSALGIVAGLAAVLFAFAWPDEESIGLTVGAALGVFIVALIPGATIHGFVFPRHPIERWGFGLAIISAITLALASNVLPGWAVTLLAWAALVPGLFGVVIWVLRGWNARRFAPAFAALPLDANVGEVLVFGGDGDPEVDGDSAFEVLPRSRLLYQPGVIGQWGWTHVDIAEVAAPPESPREWVAGHAEAQWADDDEYWYRGRKLLASEADELRRMVRRVPRKAMLELLVVFVLANLLTQVVQYLVFVLEIQASGAAWVAVVLIVLGRSIRLTREWQAWRADLRRGEVLRARSAGESPLSAEVLVEILPESGVIWTEAGQPAAWRQAPQ
jgi:hypothetical protein